MKYSTNAKGVTVASIGWRDGGGLYNKYRLVVMI